MEQSRRKIKIGRNAPCPCGSGKKHKRCCRNSAPLKSPAFDALQSWLRQREAAEKQRQDQQGLGKPIITQTLHGRRFVAVGDEVFQSAKWRTFHDFLFDYVKLLLGEHWGTEELQKPSDERHPILNWYHDSTIYLNSYIKQEGIVHSAPNIGCASAYLRLAYNLYLLSHNAVVQNALIRRLKDKTQFYPAYYETFVAAALIKAGFAIEFENESDFSMTHCELIATSKRTGKKFSVEAKRREPHKGNANVGNQLYAALKKQSTHERVVFIEINLPNDKGKDAVRTTVSDAVASIRNKEDSLKIGGVPAPRAYVIITNDPYQYGLNADVKRWAFVEGFKIPDLKLNKGFSSIREAVDSRDRHVDILNLMQSLGTHDTVPSTFEGENPELAFVSETDTNGLKIGELYVIPNQEGKEVVGELTDVCVMESKQLAIGTFRSEDGRNFLAECPLTDKEFAAYKSHPTTFFGKVKPTTQTRDFVDFYDRTLQVYSNSPKENLLKLMAGAADFERLKTLSQPELAKLYTEYVVESVARTCREDERRSSGG